MAAVGPALLTGGKTLIDSGRLLQSLTHNATDQGVEVGTNVIYAAVRRLGATIKPVTARPSLRYRRPSRLREAGDDSGKTVFRDQQRR